MASKAQQKRKELREQRLKAEAAAKSGDQRQNLFKIVGIAAFIAVIAIAAIVVVSLSGGDDSGKDPSAVNRQLAGIPQNGTLLGDPKAPVTLVEFGDLQCPACQQTAEQILPDVIAGPIKAGKAKLDFQNWTIIGPDSNEAAKAALAASLQNKYWNYIENFYADQGFENSGYVTDDFLTEIAEKSEVPDMDKWNEDRNDPKWDKVITDTDELAVSLGFTGTPSFAIKSGDGELTPIQDTGSSEALIKAINDAQ